MTFDKVLSAFKAGKKIRRSHWFEGVGMLRTEDHVLTVAALEADDWEVLEEPEPEVAIEELRAIIVRLYQALEDDETGIHLPAGLAERVQKIRRKSDPK
jgi:hypothetical protein